MGLRSKVWLVVVLTGAGCDHGRSLQTLADGAADASNATDSGAPTSVDMPPLPDTGPPRQTKWIELGLAGTAKVPPGRMNHFAVYDPQQDRLLVFGGYDPYKPDGGCCANPYAMHKDIWQLDLASDTWSRVADLPHPMLSYTPGEVAVDSTRNRLVVVGAVPQESYGVAQNFAIDLTSWKVTTLPVGPWPNKEWPLRVAFDAVGERVVVHSAYSMTKLEGVWVLDLNSDKWIKVVTPTHPPFRFHTPLTGSVGGKMLLFSGYDGEKALTDLWELDLDGKKWRQISLPQIRGRWSHRAAFDATRGSLVIFGGSRHGSKALLETLLVDIAAQSFTEPVLSPTPLRRRDHTMVLDTKRRRALIYGGAFESKYVFEDVWALQLP